MPRPSQIVFVNNFAGPGMGGGEVLLLHLIRGCREAGWQVTVICPPTAVLGSLAASAGATVTTTPMSCLHLYGLLKAIRREARFAQILEGTGFYTNMATRVAAFGLKCRVVNLVQTIPAYIGTGRRSLRMLMRRLAEVLTSRRVTAYIAVSASVASSLVRGGAPADVVYVVRNGVDVDGLRHDALSGSAPNGLPEGSGPLVGCIARLEHVKGVDLFLAAAEKIRESIEHARFVIAGDGSERSALEQQVVPPLKNNLVFLGQVTPIAPLIQLLDVMVLPSRSEGLPTVVLEAAALRVPVVATAVGGTVEAVVDGETGLLVPSSDAAALAEAVLALLGDTHSARAMGEAAAMRVEAEFSVDRMKRDTLEIYAQLMRLERG